MGNACSCRMHAIQWYCQIIVVHKVIQETVPIVWHLTKQNSSNWIQKDEQMKGHKMGKFE